MTDRYTAWLVFQSTLDTVRLNIIGLGALFMVGYWGATILPPKVKRWVQPGYEILLLVIVYGVMAIGLLTVPQP